MTQKQKSMQEKKLNIRSFPSDNMDKLLTADVEFKSNEFFTQILRPDGQVKNKKMVKKLKNEKVCVVVELLFGELFSSLFYRRFKNRIIVRFEDRTDTRREAEREERRTERERERQ